MKETKYTILIVDDDPSFRSGLARVFHALRNTLVTETFEAENGEKAVQALALRPVDCILLDYHMPGGTGLQWMSVVREKQPDAAVIMVTGAGDENIAVQAMKSGAIDYLVKGSITPESLHRAVLNAIQKREMAKLIQQQQKDLLDAERQRVVIESLGAACHHLGQPATVITTYLELMRRKEQSAEMLEMIENCAKAARSMEEVLARLRSVSEYRTVSYLPQADGKPTRTDERILRI